MKHLFLLLVTLFTLLSGCSTIHQGVREPAQQDATWAMLPFINNTETPFAAERAEAICSALLYARGVREVLSPPLEPAQDQELLPDRGIRRQQEGVAWARQKGIRYGMQGTVTEWRYKVGLDGEPVAGVTLQLLDLQSGRVIWSGAAGRSGWSREAVSAVAQQLLESLISRIPVQ